MSYGSHIGDIIFIRKEILMSELMSLLPEVVDAVQVAGQVLRSRFKSTSRQHTAAGLLAAIAANDAAVTTGLKDALLTALPGSHWVEEEEEGGALPAGDWWVVDPAEGNVNHIHGRTAWGVTATLIRDGVPVLTVALLPMIGELYTAVLGQGAFLNGQAMSVSAKTEVNAAIVGTGQAMPGETGEIFSQIGQSVTKLLETALLIRMSVPATLELVEVAAGRMDGFWQYSQVRSGLVSGALLVREAGGMVTDTNGAPWTLESRDFLAAAPGVHAALLAVLATIS